MMPGTVEERGSVSRAAGNPRLHVAIVRAGLSYEELADRLHVDPKTVERWVNEPGRRPYARHAVAVGRELGVDSWELWPSMARTVPEAPEAGPSPVQSAVKAARSALEGMAGVDVTTASPTEMALQLGALSATVRTILDLLVPAEVSA